MSETSEHSTVHEENEDSRLEALTLALEWSHQHNTVAPGEIIKLAGQMYRFLTGTLPVRLRITNGSVSTQDLSAPAPTGGTAMQIHDNQQFDIVVDALDSKGQEVADAFTATSDNEAALTVVPGADGKTFTLVAGLPGSAVVTVSDGSGLSVTEAVDVVPGGAATISITEGAVSEQPPAAPPV